jgi:hypothetical protein
MVHPYDRRSRKLWVSKRSPHRTPGGPGLYLCCCLLQFHFCVNCRRVGIRHVQDLKGCTALSKLWVAHGDIPGCVFGICEGIPCLQRCHDAAPAGNSALVVPAWNNDAALDDTVLNRPLQDERESLVAVLRARRRRRLEAAGQPYADGPQRSWTGSPHRALSLTDVLRGRYRE